MEKFRQLFCQIDDFLAKTEDIFVASMHGMIAIMVMLAVLLRYLFNNPLTWGEELIVAMLTWMVFIGAAAATRSQMHIRIDLIAPVLRMAKFNWINTVTLFAGIVTLIVMIYGCYDQFLQELVVDSPMMGVSKGWFVAAMPVGFSLMLIHVLRTWMDQGAAPVFRGETESLVMNEGGIQ